MFRDRVVSMEQTQEIGEKHIDLLTALAAEALPGFALSEHGLEHEQDLYVVTLANADSGETRSVAFTRMVLSDAERLPAIVADGAAPIRARIVDLIRSQAGRRRIVVAMRELQTEDERVEADAIEAEWRVKHEAALAAKRAEDERRARERQKQKQAEDARRQAQREREKRQRTAQVGAQGGGSHGNQAPAAQPGEGGGRRRRRRGRGGQNRGNTPGIPQQANAQAQPQGPRPQQPQQPRPQPQPQQGRPTGEAAGPRPEGGGRRRRRRGRGRGGNAGGGAPPAPSVL
jgi:ribonuclease E